jgi:DNA-binding response OmpR family regulator
VSESSGGPTVLIVDDDLGFVCWLGERFHEAGYRSLPALNARQAGSLAKELNIKINVLVVNPGLRGVRRLIKTLNHADSPPVKVILIRDPASSTAIVIRAHAILERPSGWEVVSRHEWLRKLRRILKEVEDTAAIGKISGYPSR